MSAAGTSPQGSLRERYALAVLCVVMLMNYLDRSMIAILQEPIKRDLSLSDTQLGALTGSAFALVYSTIAIPVGRIADSAPRKMVMLLSLVVWTAMTGLSGLAASFAWLVVLRMGVAIGEAGSVPATQSLIADYFPRERRGRAMAWWAFAGPAGVLSGFALGGLIAVAINWRVAFLAMGLAGLLFAPFLLRLREPPRGRHEPVAAGGPIVVRAALAAVWSKRSIRYLVLAISLTAYAMYAMQNWFGSFYMREHHLSLRATALSLALMMGLGGGVGTLVGGVLVDRLGRRSSRWYGLVPAIASFLCLPVALAEILSPSAPLSLGLGFLTMGLLNINMAPVPTAVQTLVPPRARALASAVTLAFANLVGFGLGPLVTGAVSDVLAVRVGAASLRLSLLFSLIPLAVGAGFFLVAARWLEREMKTEAVADPSARVSTMPTVA